MISPVDRIDARGSWTQEERRWLRQCYAVVRLGFATHERLASDLSDFDLPRRRPKGVNEGQRARLFDTVHESGTDEVVSTHADWLPRRE
jgi:hypothetical protein